VGPDRVPLVGGQLVDQLPRGVAPEHGDHLGVVRAERHALHAEPALHAVLGRATPPVVGELVLRDPEEPRDGRGGGPAETPARDQRRRERLGGEVGGDLGIADAACEVAQEHVDVAVVELAEVLGIAREQEVLVAVHDSPANPRTSHRFCDK
jgi:hypothetical protein